MPARLLLPLILLAIAASTAAAQEPRLRLLSVAKDMVRLEVQLDAPAAVEVEYGEELFAWDGRAESPVPAEKHELALTRLIPNRQYFYRVLVDGFETGEVLTFRSGRSWIDRTAQVDVLADTPSGDPAEATLAERLFADSSQAVVALGGDGGDPEGFRALHGRTMTERPVVETGGTGDTEALRTVAVSDLAIASVGENPLVLADGSPSPAAQWLATALPAEEGACWLVAASAQAVEPDSPAAKALLAWAKSVGVHAVLTPSSRPVLVEGDEVAWIGLPDPAGSGEHSSAQLRSAGGTLILKLLDGAGKQTQVASMTRDCPIPQSLLSSAESAHGDDEDGFGGGESDLEGGAEECDY